MKVLCLQGSPRLQGNTAKVLGWVEDELRAKGHTVDHVDVAPIGLRGCGACNVCKQVTDAPGCVQKDGGNAVLMRLLAADAVIFASPLYCWGFSSQLKALVDRAYCLIKADANGAWHVLSAGKRYALVMTGGDEVEGNLDLAVPPFKAFTHFFQGQEAGILLVPFCTSPDKMKPEVESQARELAHQITKP